MAQQLYAVERVVSNAKRELIHDHIEHCLDGPDADTKSARRELKQLASMTFSPEFLLIVSVGVVGVLHTIVPHDWVPITLIARLRGWSKSETVSQPAQLSPTSCFASPRRQACSASISARSSAMAKC